MITIASSTVELYQVACWKHTQAQEPWDASQVSFWQGAAAGLAWALKAQGITDAQLNRMEEDAIALGPSGRWDGIIEKLDTPDGTVRLED